ncbi:MAG: antitoxin [Verrucomicrobia bacterium]|nr:antitoxin [Verrucomicrobiota bacterium]MDA1088523.1 antitoxin [Verrucomicrobiota bacterium]
MIKTQIQLPDRLYLEAKRVAREREISLAEVVRRGVEYIARAYPPVEGAPGTAWTPPAAEHLGAFRASVENWRDIASETGP